MKQKFFTSLIALGLPFLLLGVILFQGITSFDGTEYRFRITGYDPRDPLRGHYLQFRYEWSAPSTCKPDEVCVVCITGDTKYPSLSIESATSETLITQKPHCSTYWRMMPVASKDQIPQPSEEFLRYYIPELEAPVIERLLRLDHNIFSVGVIPHKDGTATVKHLYINDKLLSDYLKD